MDQSRDMWEGDGSEVKNAEPGLVLGRLLLTRGRQETLEAGRRSLSTASMVRIMQVHEGPSLQPRSVCHAMSLPGAKETYSSNPLVESQREVGNIGRFKEGRPSMLVDINVVVEDHGETDSHIDGGETSKTDQGLLANAHPWRVADAEKDGLRDVRIGG